MHAIVVNAHGGPEALQYQEAAKPTPGEGQALIKVAAAGVNFIDVYNRKGVYPTKPPFTPGGEAAGTVEEVGAGVTTVKAGDRVAYAVTLTGGYAEYVVMTAERLVPLPDSVDFQTAAAAMLQGMTAHYLTHSTYPIQPGDPVLIHAAAGGTGALAVQMAKMRGGFVIATVSTEEKAKIAREAGADEVIMYTQQEFDVETRRITNGAGVAAVYDSVGKTTFDKSLNCLRPRGVMVLFGGSSGQVPPFDLQQLNSKGSLYITRPTMGHYVIKREELLQRAGDVFDWIAAGKLQIRIDQAYPLAQAAEAHTKIEARGTTGKLLLIP